MMPNLKHQEAREPKLQLLSSCNEDHAHLFPELMRAQLWLAWEDVGVSITGGSQV